MKHLFLPFLALLLLALLAFNKSKAQGILHLHMRDRLHTYRQHVQERRATQERWLLNETALVIGDVQDLRMSENTYVGPGLSIGRGRRVIGPKATRQFNLTAGYAFLTPSHAKSNAHNARAEISYAYLRHLDDKSGWKIRAGGALNVMANGRLNTSLGNSAVYVDIATSLSAVAYVSKEIHIRKRTSILDASLRLPVVTYMNRLPEFGLSGFSGFSSSIAPIGKYTRIGTEIGLTNKLGRSKTAPNRIRVAYCWDMYHYNDAIQIHPMTLAYHSLSFTYLIRL